MPLRRADEAYSDRDVPLAVSDAGSEEDEEPAGSSRVERQVVERSETGAQHDRLLPHALCTALYLIFILAREVQCMLVVSLRVTVAGRLHCSHR